MGLTNQSTGVNVLDNELKIQRTSPYDKIIALTGNPNVGKSTVFNSLTGLNQHTGNWPGKTVTNAQGKYKHKETDFIMVDIPGTYSLMANSVEEEVARDFVCFGNPDATIIVTDATCLERNMNLVLQTLEITPNVVVCVNLIDEAKRKKINIDLKELSANLGVPVIGTNARKGQGLKDLMDAVYFMTNDTIAPSPLTIHYEEPIEKAIHILEPSLQALLNDKLNSRWVALKLLDEDETLLKAFRKYLDFDLMENQMVNEQLKEARKVLDKADIKQDQLRDKIVSHIVCTAENICCEVITIEKEHYNLMDRRIDSVLTSRIFGIPIMIGLLGIIFWLTITGANYPSAMLANLLFGVEERLTGFFLWAGTPTWVHGLLVLGVYRTLAWVISVMLPPMAIFSHFSHCLRT